MVELCTGMQKKAFVLYFKAQRDRGESKESDWSPGRYSNSSKRQQHGP